MPDAQEDFTVTDSMEECCKDPDNRSLPMSVDHRNDLTFTVCKCGRRHFELSVDAGKLGLKFT